MIRDRQEHTAIMIYSITGNIKVEAVHTVGLLFMNNYATENQLDHVLNKRQKFLVFS